MEERQEEWTTRQLPEYTAADPADIVCKAEPVRRALDRLSPGYRQALLLHTLTGFTIEEIAEVCGFAASGGKMYLSRARRRFQLFYLQETKNDDTSSTAGNDY